MIQISVIIPTYGSPVFLSQSIKSVINQTFQDWELIIVDDNNPNTQARLDTEKIVSIFMASDKRVKYIKHEKNMNGAVARNTGFAVAQGKYIALLDSDDEYMLERLQRCFDLMESSADSVAGVYTGCEFRRSGSSYHVFKRVKSGKFLVETLACTFMFCTGSNIFVRKSIVDELNGFDPSFLRHQDYEFLVRVFEKYSLLAIPEILVIKNNENFNLPNVEKLVSIKNQYLNKYSYIINKLPIKDINYIKHQNYISIAECALRQSNTKIAREYYKKAAQFSGLTIRERFRRLLFPLYNLLHKK